MFECLAKCISPARLLRPLTVTGICGLIALNTAAVEETFDYADGLLEGAGAVGDWAGPWQAGPATDLPTPGTTPFQVESGQLKIDFMDTTSGGYTDSDVERSLASPIATPSVYVSFDITPGEMGNAVSTNQGDSYSGLNIGFANNATNIGSAGPMFSIYEYVDGNQVTYVRFDTSLGGLYDNTTSVVGDWTPGNTYTLVGRLDFDTALGAAEQWTVWLDPEDESSTPQVVASGDLGYDSIGMIRMWQYVYNFENADNTFIDNLSIGSTWPGLSIILGDMDGNGTLNNADIAPFVMSLTDPTGYEATYPGLDPDILGDFSGNGLLDNADIAGFVDALTGGSSIQASELDLEQLNALAAVPEPGSFALLGLGGLMLVYRRR